MEKEEILQAIRTKVKQIMPRGEWVCLSLRRKMIKDEILQFDAVKQNLIPSEVTPVQAKGNSDIDLLIKKNCLIKMWQRLLIRFMIWN